MQTIPDIFEKSSNLTRLYQADDFMQVENKGIQQFFSPIQIGNVKLEGNIFLAPVAGYSDVVFRSLCVSEGASLTYTEMVSSEALVRSCRKTHSLMEKSEEEKKYAIQIFGSNPHTMSEAAKCIAEEYAPSIIDVNAGCPMPKITKQGAGSALLETPALLYDILKSLVKAMQVYNIPVTVKIRAGKNENKISWQEASKVAIEAGVAAITLHPRTQVQCYSGVSAVELIGSLKEMASVFDVKVFGSGDLFTPFDALNMFRKTACDGIMFARGAMGNPFIFRQTKDLLLQGHYEEIPLKEKIAMGLKELHLLAGLKGEKSACLEMRRRIMPYIKGVNGVAEFRRVLVHSLSIAEYEEVLNKIGDTTVQL